jgi:hypothetical protein
MSVLDKLIRQSVECNGLQLPYDEKAQSQWPDLFALMTTVLVNGKLGRKPSSLRISLGTGEWLASLSEEMTRQSITVGSPTLAEVFHKVQSYLISPDCTWRPWGGTPYVRKPKG